MNKQNKTQIITQKAFDSEVEPYLKFSGILYYDPTTELIDDETRKQAEFLIDCLNKVLGKV